MYCKYLSKKVNGGFKCKKYKQGIISLDVCKNCLDFIFAKNKPIKKISKKRITVSKETYNKVLKRDKEKCRLLDGTCQGGLELHHIIYRSENKKLIDEADNCIMLCTKHHKQVHSNKHYWQPILKNIIKKGAYYNNETNMD
jgi:2-polyprenyl-3-methyl-5-hydroxy-6-metoxy-1,4-benzoquinol methylase